MNPMQFDGPACRDLSFAVSREWLDSNGLGGYASSTIVGLNTRRYHGLLVAVDPPLATRLVLLARLEETLYTGDGTITSSSTLNATEGWISSRISSIR